MERQACCVVIVSVSLCWQDREIPSYQPVFMTDACFSEIGTGLTEGCDSSWQSFSVDAAALAQLR